MDDSIIRSCILFFLVALDDEEDVYAATEVALTNARRLKAQRSNESLMSLVVSEASSFYSSQKYKSLGSKRELDLVNPPRAELLKELKTLSKHTPNKIFVPFLWSEVAKAPLSEVAKGLNLTEGTVEYRSHEVLKKWAEES